MASGGLVSTYRTALLFALSFPVLSACGGSLRTGTSIPPASDSTGATSPGYAIIYRFTNRHGDGARPYSRLIAVNGILYGTTLLGGNTKGLNNPGCGTVFSVTLSGKETVLYRFKGGSDGCRPQGGLTAINGTLYGTTAYGGTYDQGTVFAISASGKKKTVVTFDASRCGNPTGDAITIRGVLFVACSNGGSGAGGTVVSVSTSGVVRRLHQFEGSPSDGQNPQAGLLYYQGTLFGTTQYGGREGCQTYYSGCGTVFKIGINPPKSERTLSRFTSPAVHPLGSLAVLGGTLYGTTAGSGDGTIFSLSPSGKVKVLYTFVYAKDGGIPYAGPIAFKKRLYGTTYWGGGCQTCGTIYSVTPSGSEKVLHTFAGGRNDGAASVASMMAMAGTLYGTTSYGGGGNCKSGCGTIFAITPK